MSRGTRVSAASGRKEGEATGSAEDTLEVHSPTCWAQSCTTSQLFLGTARVSEVTLLQKLFDKQILSAANVNRDTIKLFVQGFSSKTTYSQNNIKLMPSTACVNSKGKKQHYCLQICLFRINTVT